MRGRCLTDSVRVVLLIGAVVASLGWALRESRPLRHPATAPHVIEAAATPALPEPVVRARPAPPPSRPPPPPPILAHAEPPPLPRMAKISGRIVDSEGKPAPEAKLDLDSGKLCIWLSVDELGRFEALLPPGAWELSAFIDKLESSTTMFVLDAGEEVNDLLFELPPAPPEELELHGSSNDE